MFKKQIVLTLLVALVVSAASQGPANRKPQGRSNVKLNGKLSNGNKDNGGQHWEKMMSAMAANSTFCPWHFKNYTKSNCTGDVPHIFNMTKIGEIGKKLSPERKGKENRDGRNNGVNKHKKNTNKRSKRDAGSGSVEEMENKGSSGNRKMHGGPHGSEDKENCTYKYLKNPCVVDEYMKANNLYNADTSIINIDAYKTHIMAQSTVDAAWETVIGNALTTCKVAVYERDISKDPKPPKPPQGGNGPDGPKPPPMDMMKCDLNTTFFTICVMKEMIINSPTTTLDPTTQAQSELCKSILESVKKCEFNAPPPFGPPGPPHGGGKFKKGKRNGKIGNGQGWKKHAGAVPQ